MKPSTAKSKIRLPEPVRRQVSKKVSTYCEWKVPKKSRRQLRLDFEIYGHDVTIRAHRLIGMKGNKWVDSPIALLRFDFKSELWSLRYPDRNGRWHLHPSSDVKQSVDELLTIIEEDPTNHFWG